MFANSDLWLSKAEDKEKLQTYYQSKSKGIYAFTLRGTSHFNFMDCIYTISSPLFGCLMPSSLLHEQDSDMCLLGPSDALAVSRELDQALNEFFKNHLSKVTNKPMELAPSTLHDLQKFSFQ